MGTIYIVFGYALMKYFDKYRGATSGMLFAGETANSLVFPTILLQLQYHYGFRNVLFIYGAIAMHTTVLSLLLGEPPSTNLPRRTKPNNGGLQCLKGPNPLVQQSEAASSPENSLLDAGHPSVMTLFENPMFYVSLLLAMSVHFCQMTFLTTIVDYAIDRGSSLDRASAIVTYTAPADIVGRALVPLLADWNFVRRTTLILCCYAVTGASFIALPHSWSFWSFLLLCMCSCLSLGCLIASKLAFVADQFDINHFTFCVGLQGLCLIPLLLGCPSIIGEWSDKLLQPYVNCENRFLL